MRHRKSNWSHAETLQLIRLVGQKETQTAWNVVHSRIIWEGISAKLKTGRTAEQCQERWSYLKRRYRETVSKRQTDKLYTCNYFNELNRILGKRTTGIARPATPSSAAPSTTSRATTSDPSPTAHQTPAAPPQRMPAPDLPEVPESDYDENEDDDDEEEDGDVVDIRDPQGAEENDMQDLFAQSQTQGQEMGYSAEMPENNENRTTEPSHTSCIPTAATNSTKPSKRAASSHQKQQNNSKKPRGRPRSSAPPPRDDMTVAQAMTDAVMRFIDHQSYHLTEQTKLLQRYLKFERARMRWEMDMETRRMKWEEEREMREEERRQRHEELQAKRVLDNKEFMLQMAVVLGNGAQTGTSQDRDTEN